MEATGSVVVSLDARRAELRRRRRRHALREWLGLALLAVAIVWLAALALLTLLAH